MKKGDTLIEVTLAVGIFSMVAVAITAVMSSGTAGAQTALETTLTREEVDTQAEALRFIQTAYASNKQDTENNGFRAIWEQITDHAIDLGKINESDREAILQYHPDNCSELYSNININNQNAFVINPRQLGNYINDSNIGVDSVYIPYVKKNNTKNEQFAQASVYPRLTYGSNAADANTNAQSLSSPASDNLFRAEGIYVIAVKGSNTPDSTNSKANSFYDFYIRTCWYGIDANQPSTISTVIRLHNPDAI